MTEGNHSTSDLRPVLQGRRILLGVSGGIAAYKSPLLVRRLREAGADVQVVLTRSAERFVTTTTLQAVSGQPVRNDLWDEGAEASMGHIELARWAELLVVAPATADLLSRFAGGRADDLLTTLRLATRAPVLLAPAMNVAMWEHTATQRNIAQLRDDGCSIAGPDSGPMACGEFGPGRMVEPEALLRQVAELLAGGAPATAAIPALRGRRILITAGPTREAIDPVRFISNHSSGKQGYALAAAARAAGASVTLVSGPVALSAPQGVTTVPVTSAQDMYDAVMARVNDCDIFIGVAAVADYRPASAADQKLKKSQQSPRERSLELVENPDIIAAVARHQPRPLVIGFAAETQDAVAFARDKRRRKGLDMIVVNDVSQPDSGFNSDDNTVTVITDNEETQLPRTSKAQVARAILEAAARSLGGTARSNEP